MGFPPNLLATRDTMLMDNVIKQLGQSYTFVIINEYYEESLVMLRRRLCWGLSDILHSNKKIHEQDKPKKYIPFTDKQLENHRRINAIDYRMKSSDVRSSLITANDQVKLSGVSCKVPVTNVMFIKAEDTVSEGTARILLRFAYNHHMAICHQTGADNFLLTHSRIDASDCQQNEGKSNTLFMYQPVLPGTKYIGIISEPVTSFLLRFFDKHNLKVLGLENHPNPLGAYLDNPEINERSSAKRAPQRYVGQRNKQALQLGFPPDLDKTSDTDIMDTAIKQLNERYTFVIISEYYEESLVMLRRKLCLDMYDILHSINKNPKKYIPFTEKQLENHRRINTIDYRMYDFFNKTFWRSVQEEEGRGFSGKWHNLGNY
ncbi:hypothetical protein Bbelb_056310 [Branchiostoma belcheri]|nr:hypothetical protein Bbelb_056310 [Branchiostoma belcheri]